MKPQDCKFTMSLDILKRVTQQVRDKEIPIDELCQLIKDHDLYDYATAEWTDYIRYELLETLGSNGFWKKVCAIQDFNIAKYKWRYFPIDSNIDEIVDISNEVFRDNYSNWTDSRPIKSANGRWIPSWMRTGTNWGIVHVSKPDQHAAMDLDMIIKVLDAVQMLPNSKLYIEILALLCTNYDTCALVIKHEGIARHLTGVFRNAGLREWWDLMRHMLFYSMFILRHEESICKSPTPENRWILTLDQAHCMAQYHNGSTTNSPLLPNWVVGNAPLEMFTPFYLHGQRRLVDLDEFHRRFDMVADPALRRLQKWSNVVVVGSVLVSCIADNKLNDPPQRVYDDDDIGCMVADLSLSRDSYNIAQANDEGFLRRHRLYYPREGERAMCSDLDIAVYCHEDFDKQVMEMIAEINRDQEVPYRWVAKPARDSFRYHVTHPITKLKLEIFKTFRPPMEMVSNYHVTCVRMYYDFKQVWMTRNCASALITGICESYNWFSNNKNPMDIVLKYAQRGYTTILNIKELECIERFCTSSERWNYVRSSGYSSIVGRFDSNHIFFRVDAVPKGIRLGLPADTQVQYDTRGLYRFNNKDLPLKYGDVELVRYEDENLAQPLTL